jgi:FkbH-like protein
MSNPSPINNKEHILLLGNCGFERLAEVLRAKYTVTVAGLYDYQLIDSLHPVLIYVDLFDWSVMTPIYAAGIRSLDISVPSKNISAIISSLVGKAVWYRGIRKPSGGAFGIWQKNLGIESAIGTLEELIREERVIDIQALWALHGVSCDDVSYGLGHGEALLNTKEPLLPARIEADALFAILDSRAAIKCIVVDLDDTLIYGNIISDDFISRNPAYGTNSQKERGWWMLRRGLHEALQIARQRGIVLALASRNEEYIVQERFVKREDLGEDAASVGLRHIALDIHDFTILEIGFQHKSQSCLRIAERLGIGLDTLAFLDNSQFEQEEVATSLPMVHVVRGLVEDFRRTILTGPRFQPWFVHLEPQIREDSYRSRSLVQEQPKDRLLGFLHGLEISLWIRPPQKEEIVRVQELLNRTHQLVLTSNRTLPSCNYSLRVAHVEDRIANHGLVAVGVFTHRDDGWYLYSWVCSCRVLPHRVAASILFAMCADFPNVSVVREALERNGASVDLIEQSKDGIASWVQYKTPINSPNDI